MRAAFSLPENRKDGGSLLVRFLLVLVFHVGIDDSPAPFLDFLPCGLERDASRMSGDRSGEERAVAAEHGDETTDYQVIDLCLFS